MKILDDGSCLLLLLFFFFSFLVALDDDGRLFLDKISFFVMWKTSRPLKVSLAGTTHL